MREYYKNLWTNYPHITCEEKCHKEFILTELKKIPYKNKILDLGCGRGWLTNQLSKYGNVLGVDLFTQEAEMRYPDLNFLEIDFLNEYEKIPNDFDVIISSEVIEHIPLEKRSLFEKIIFDRLKPRGFCIITTPNKKRVDQFQVYVPQPEEHQFDIAEILNLFKIFSIIKIKTMYFFPQFILKKEFLSRIYLLGYSHCRLYKIVDRIFGNTERGISIGIVLKR